VRRGSGVAELLLREDGRGVLAIGQPSHAWISGQLARAWGNARFGAIEPYEEVCLAAEQHDIGMAQWDLTPTRNPDTGLPHSFMQMPLTVHLELWRAGPPQLVRQCRYAALLASRHGSRLYEARDLRELPAADAEAVRSFLNDGRRFQEELLASLRSDPVTACVASEQLFARNSQLIWTWDFLSLALCLDWAPRAAQEVPTADAPVELRVRPGDQPHRVTLDPWPFADVSVTVRCEGQRLTGRFETDEALGEALARAPWETLQLELVAAG
jgi:Protein of unknown function (DUF3891)